MKKVLILLLGIASLSFSTNLLANDKDFYAGWEELKLYEAEKTGFEIENDGAELLYKHIMFYTDNTCTKKLDIKYSETEYAERQKIPYRLVYTYKYQGKEKLRIKTNLCVK
ncbi:Uncharacterised protein [Actinobacillus porcinus]|uniref:Uncharacterized protein n=1 Tax=Actinobacillus porcinus TaxID=51048 RepID=A0ABY6TIV9_9PAST|nr:hypothetical protein [Actinobacillus porcinus]VFY92872.1 Uncharacterised protein [Actinobacillus porcinus]VTU07340.1 Uncharacterised protein [Actinobacillus porcinus]